MSGNRPDRRAVRIAVRVCGLLILAWTGLAQAWDYSDILHYPLALWTDMTQGRHFPDMLHDPMAANPAILQTGPSLPGQTTPMPCPPDVDLSQALALSDAVDLALCNNAQLKEAWAEIKIQSGALGETWATFMPTLTGTYSLLNSTTQYPAFPSANTSEVGHTVYVGFSWRLFDFGARLKNLETSNQLLIAALAGHDAAMQKVLVSVIGGYFDAMTSLAVLEARTDSTRLAQETLDATSRRELRGVASVDDTLQAKTALAKARLAQQRASGDYRKAVAVLVYAMGLGENVDIRLPANMDAPQPQAIGDLTGWLAETEKSHPAILAAEAKLKAAQAKIESVRAAGLPTVDFTYNFYQNGYPNQGLQTTSSNTGMYGVVLTIPFFDGYAHTYKVRGAEAQAEQTAAQLQDTEQQILSDVVKAHADALSALGNLDASQDLLDAAQASLASSRKRYDKGAADVLELLSAQAALADARQERIRCLAEWQAARLRLLASAGILGRDEPLHETLAQ